MIRTHRSWVASAAAATLLGVAGSAIGGFADFDVTIDEMESVNGFVDFDNPFDEEYAELIEIGDPPAGSYIEFASGIPDVGEFASNIVFGSNNAGTAMFTFTAMLDVASFADNPFGLDLAVSGHRVTFTSEVDVIVTLLASVDPGTSDNAYGFLEVYGDGVPEGTFFSPGDNPIAEEFVLQAGTSSVAFGAAVGPDGGFGGFNGTIAFTAVPAPGAVALLGIAGLLARRRRR
ncbi:MAG: hypothetical protein ACYTFH_05090 [Planctomycetota bacterium]|jgi:hypothetical protein